MMLQTLAAHTVARAPILDTVKHRRLSDGESSNSAPSSTYLTGIMQRRVGLNFPSPK